MGSYLAYYLTGFIMIPVFIFATYCQIKVKTSFSKYSKIRNRRGMTGAQAAYELLMNNGITDVKIKKIAGTLTDYYDPKNKEICLSQDVFDSTSVAAVGVACHEAGHACQHAQGYSPLKLRNPDRPTTRIGAIVGMFLYSNTLIYAGLILYSAVALFQLITLPVEFNASKRALETIDNCHYLEGEEYNGAKKVLTAAALTYVAALASALATLLRLFLIINRGNRN